MKPKIIALVLGMLLTMPCALLAEEIKPYCENDTTIHLSCVVKCGTDVPSEELKYYLSADQRYGNNNDTLNADSVWIINTNEEVVMVVKEAVGEPVDILSLEKGYYLLCAQYGDCIMGCMFYKRLAKPTVGLEGIHSEQPVSNKFLRDGQLYLMYKGIMYNVQGYRLGD